MRTGQTRTSEPGGTVGGRARREQIEGAAAAVLAEVGYAAASIGRIADRAGVSKGVVTYHFASKDDLLRRMALRVLQECSTHIEAHAADANGPTERMRAELAAELWFFSTRRVEFRALSEVLANHRDPSFARAFEDVADAETATLAQLLVAGQQAGTLREFDAEEVAHLIQSAKNGVLARWAEDESVDLVAATASLLDFVEHAVLAR